MSSYNNITKIKYTGSPSDLVTLDEYIVFQDDKAKRKYIIFKFINNVTQQLLGMEFEVSQYNVDGDLIEKSVVVYNKFLAGAEEEFVPKAKLRVSYKCKTVSIRLIKAAFDRFVWKEGEYEDNSFKFEHFYSDEVAHGNNGGEKNAKQKKEKPVDEKKEKKKKAKREKKNKKRFELKDASKKNFAKFPSVFNMLIFVAVIVFAFSTVLIFKCNSKKYTEGEYLVRALNETDVAVYGYIGSGTDIIIPDKIGEKKVTRIDAGAFKKSKITSVSINCSLTIGTGAFVDCKNLQTVYAPEAYKITVMEYGFENCPSLTVINFSSPLLYPDAFVNCGNGN